MTAAAKLARAEARMARRFEALYQAVAAPSPVFWRAEARWRRARDVAELRRNQAGVTR